MTTPTHEDAAEASTPAAPVGGPARASRRGPADLPFDFADRGLVDALVAERGEPDWLRDERLAALAAYESLPVESNRLYTPYVDLRAADLTTVRPYVATAGRPASIPPVPDGTSGLIELREDGVAALVLSADAETAGVRLETFAAALERDPDGLRADLEGGRTLPLDDKFAQLARGFWSQGVRLIVPAGVRLDRPFLVRWAVGNPERALISRTRHPARRGRPRRRSSRSWLPRGRSSTAPPARRCLSRSSAPPSRSSSSGSAGLAVASIQELPVGVVAFQHRHATIGEAATLDWALAQLGGRLVRSRVDNRLEGDRGTVEQVEIVFGSGDQLFDLTSYTRHIGRDTTGNLLSKGALMDASRSYLKGLIVIDRTAVGTDSFLGEFGMNLSKQTRAVAIPSLEIDQPDCRRAAHSSSVGPIDETQLFYLESRGIEPDEARKFIVLGFLEPVVARVPLEAARDRLRALLEEKWAEASPAATRDAA